MICKWWRERRAARRLKPPSKNPIKGLFQKAANLCCFCLCSKTDEEGEAYEEKLKNQWDEQGVNVHPVESYTKYIPYLFKRQNPQGGANESAIPYIRYVFKDSEPQGCFSESDIPYVRYMFQGSEPQGCPNESDIPYVRYMFQGSELQGCPNESDIPYVRYMFQGSEPQGCPNESDLPYIRYLFKDSEPQGCDNESAIPYIRYLFDEEEAERKEVLPKQHQEIITECSITFIRYLFEEKETQDDKDACASKIILDSKKRQEYKDALASLIYHQPDHNDVVCSPDLEASSTMAKDRGYKSFIERSERARHALPPSYSLCQEEGETIEEVYVQCPEGADESLDGSIVYM